MPTPFTGSLGWTAAHPFQFGGPPLTNTYARPLPTIALPLLAHVYEADAVTSKGLLKILNRPPLKAVTANGGYDQITLEAETRLLSATYGQAVYGQATYGGAVQQGNVIRLTEVGGPWNGFIYSGVVESMPDIRSAAGTKHELVVSPFGWELLRVPTQLLYVAPVDVAQMVRDAVALTQHCSCDQTSVPPSTGIFAAVNGAVDFRNQKASQVLDAARSIAGPTWFWYADELGRVWFQSQGSAAVYTLRAGQHYEERVTDGGSITARINQVLVVGGVPVGGSANVRAVANGILSQPSIGIRALDPPVQAPGITDLATLTAIANGILATLDNTWTRVSMLGLPPLGVPNEQHPGRVHGSQPGGAMVRYWEPIVNPLPETAAGAGYVGPLLCQSVTYDGLHQQIEAANLPLIAQADVQNMVRTWASRSAAIATGVTAAALNVPQQVVTGSYQSAPSVGNPARWVLDQTSLRAYDGSSTAYGAPSGNGVTTEIGANGQTFLGGALTLQSALTGARIVINALGAIEQVIDPSGVVRCELGNLAANGGSGAGWKLRGNDATAAPVFDSDQVFGDRVMKSLGIASGPTSPPQSFTSTTFAAVSSTSLAFSLTRPANIFAPFLATGRVNTNNGNVGFVRANLVGVTTSGNENFGVLANFAQTSSGWIFVTGLAAGSYTIELDAAVSNTQTFDLFAAVVQCFQVGG